MQSLLVNIWLPTYAYNKHYFNSRSPHDGGNHACRRHFPVFCRQTPPTTTMSGFIFIIKCMKKLYDNLDRLQVVLNIHFLLSFRVSQFQIYILCDDVMFQRKYSRFFVFCLICCRVWDFLLLFISTFVRYMCDGTAWWVPVLTTGGLHYSNLFWYFINKTCCI